MKTSRSFQFLCRLKAWQLYNGTWIRQQPILCFDREISIEECRRQFPDVLNLPPMPRALRPTSRAVLLYAPLEVEVDPTA